jgi:hypothetical protein
LEQVSEKTEWIKAGVGGAKVVVNFHVQFIPNITPAASSVLTQLLN